MQQPGDDSDSAVNAQARGVRQAKPGEKLVRSDEPDDLIAASADLRATVARIRHLQDYRRCGYRWCLRRSRNRCRNSKGMLPAEPKPGLPASCGPIPAIVFTCRCAGRRVVSCHYTRPPPADRTARCAPRPSVPSISRTLWWFEPCHSRRVARGALSPRCGAARRPSPRPGRDVRLIVTGYGGMVFLARLPAPSWSGMQQPARRECSRRRRRAGAAVEAGDRRPPERSAAARLDDAVNQDLAVKSRSAGPT